MTDALFFACDDQSKDYLMKNALSDINYRWADFDINDLKLANLPNLDKVEIVSVFAHAQPINTSQLDLFPSLKMISTRSTGYNHIDLAYCKRKNIVVCNVPNYGATAVAEFTIGVMVGLMRKIALAKSQLKTNNVFLPAYTGESIKGKTVGIIGTGAIGRAVIHLLKAFGANVIAYDPYPSEELIKQGIRYISNLTDFFQNADVISLHCPATKDNFHLLNEKAFSQMKQGVYIVNTARGSLIDTETLYMALHNGKVAGVALDVLENEDVVVEREISTDMEKKPAEFLVDSLINFKLLQLNNTLITPHIAFNSVDAIETILRITVENIKAFMVGKPINVIV